MDQIIWVDKDSVGIPSIDTQHKQLVAITNTLFMAIMHDTSEDVLKDTLDALAYYANYHFAYEEKLLAEHGYPEDKLASHIAEHRELTRQVHTFIQEAKNDPGTLDIKVFGFLRDWMSCHLSETDSQYSAFLLKKGVR
ncbi:MULTISPECIES: bacteriohemerythrin [unclassified Pseudodesulfovibrio]|uniref:bacteriohemerythrin n=1 Tax=unclassified Pseudodesulfovibrio TaxID=2661612 RepID=UPI000FEC1E49|nr:MULTISPECIES: bacteriohemerythrin [unclassified Pseudodesulfovibrio]MCJ2164866.1 bacteriohemerythrin [Pseudodesulfovibrio sp. S3-i]RWU03766.1 hemerythrin [Pseudodesulfovibrio sp. S3]